MTRLTSGETFAGYRIDRLLGVGAMGEVYLAEHPRLPRRDALKVLRSDASADPEFRARFLREADLASGLWHPNIVGVHDRGDVDGRLWIAMDFIDGRDAAQLLRQYPAGMDTDLVVAIVAAIASGLDYANERGLLHRDVKPANILLTDGGDPSDPAKRRILLTDFGIARATEDDLELTAADLTVGTVAYTAPEQLLGRHVDGRSDQYALAATAYHLLTGETMFPHSNPAVVIGNHLHSPPAPLSSRRPDLVALDPVFARALAKDPGDRYPCCTDFAADLARAVTSGEAGTQQLWKPAESAPPGGGVSRRGFVGGALVALAAVTSYVVVRSLRGEPEPPTAVTPPPPPPLPEPPWVGLGSALDVTSRTGRARYTVANLRAAKPLEPASVTGALYAVDVTIEARSGVIKVNPLQFRALTAAGVNLNRTDNIANALPIVDVAAGQKVSGPIAFDVPAGEQIAEIILAGLLGDQIGVWRV